MYTLVPQWSNCPLSSINSILERQEENKKQATRARSPPLSWISSTLHPSPTDSLIPPSLSLSPPFFLSLSLSSFTPPTHFSLPPAHSLLLSSSPSSIHHHLFCSPLPVCAYSQKKTPARTQRPTITHTLFNVRALPSRPGCCKASPPLQQHQQQQRLQQR